MHNKPFKTYFGSKHSPGVYQTLINLIPPIDNLIIGFTGNCSILYYMNLPANVTCLDMDKRVIEAWSNYYFVDPIVKCDVERSIKDFRSHTFDNVGVRLLKTFRKNGTVINLIEGDLLQYLRNERCFRKGAFLFLDPPYPHKTRTSNTRYKYDFTDSDHVQLLSLITKLKSKVLITSYANPLYNSFLKGWNQVDYKSKTRSGVRIETAYLNYDIPGRLQDYSFVGVDYRERERIKRKINREINKLDAQPARERNAIIDAVNKSFNNK